MTDLRGIWDEPDPYALTTDVVLWKLRFQFGMAMAITDPRSQVKILAADLPGIPIRWTDDSRALNVDVVTGALFGKGWRERAREIAEDVVVIEPWRIGYDRRYGTYDGWRGVIEQIRDCVLHCFWAEAGRPDKVPKVVDFRKWPRR